MEFAKLFADCGDTVEFICVFGIRNARKIDFQEFLVVFTIGWRMENSIDVIEDLLWSSFIPYTFIYFTPNRFIKVWLSLFAQLCFVFRWIKEEREEIGSSICCSKETIWN